MARTLVFTLIAFAAFTGDLSAQSTADQKPTEAEIAAFTRRVEILRHPTGIITIRLAPVGREGSITPPPYGIADRMHFDLFISLAAGEDLTYTYSRNYCYAYRPQLIREGDVLPYAKQAQECIERAEREPGGDGFSDAPATLKPGPESLSHYVDLYDWYETPLKAGHYQLLVKKQFLPGGDWVESNAVTFDVVARKPPSPISDCVGVRLVPEGLKPSREGVYRLAADSSVAVELVNDCSERVNISVIDRYYGHRVQLMRDGKAVAYSEEATKLIESKKDPRLVELSPKLYIDPKTTSRLDGFSLDQWFGTLAPGIYRLTDRRRFEIDGPWTKDSPYLVFEIIPNKPTDQD